ncbi:hypothetical protein PROFUN_03142 [Planoprotostelium fungivorum]|uniref:SHSP domain-containing protein n=1 Tax=Planoprotostelium fungivorum TaxID=1890364 RepID=A0A2P6NQC9_9EUKA|nr:hypothetical protein PROFUN_03142 [Planoprotostelium fungivorum]
MPSDTNPQALTSFPPAPFFDLFDGIDLFAPFFDLRSLKTTSRESHRNTMSKDIERTEGGYVLEAEMAGIPKENVTVEVKDGHLQISGRRKREEEREGEKVYSRSDFYQSVKLPKDVEEGSVKASYTDGLLKVEMNRKDESEKTKRITIQMGIS